MASRPGAEGQARPRVGDILRVVHDFEARKSDELSLDKGDQVELIEGDDEFGDGWFIGRHMTNGKTGLFPEVYTRPLVRHASVPATVSTPTPQPLASLPESSAESVKSSPAPTPQSEKGPDPINHSSDTPVTLPLNATKSEPKPPPTTANNKVGPGSLNRIHSTGQDSQVLNDTLNVINEHITDLRLAPNHGALRDAVTDSGSEYSAPLDRMSYIQGEETDEEEDHHTRAEVEAWSPDGVAEYLFAVGVEKQHCDVFKDQEISGEVLLGMDQSALFISAFDLGSVGRRLKTWHKIKALQDEVGVGLGRPLTQSHASDAGSDDARRVRSRNNTMTSGSISQYPGSINTKRLSSTQTPKASPTTYGPSNPLDGSPRPGHAQRPSAASIRDLQSRRHSSTDFRINNAGNNRTNVAGLQPAGESNHKKQPSFDRNWTLGGAAQPRPLSSTGLQDIVAQSNSDLQDSAVDLDRGYFSGTEADAGKKRKFLRKRDSGGQSQRASYAEEQRVRSATALSRHSRFGSYDSYRDSAPTSAAQKYYGVQSGAHKRTASAATAESVRPVPPAKDYPPAVTKLNEDPDKPRPPPKHGFTPDWLAFNKPLGKGMLGLRSSSENHAAQQSETSVKDTSMDSSARTGSSTPSGGQSFEMDSPEAGKSFNKIPIPLRNGAKKGKKETSAYTRGLLKISPKEAMQDADYSGWMKKKSSNLMTTWKPRFFVLKGRRLSYYYSMDDDQEKGLIDISFHRVLPADNDRLTGLHATITGVVGDHLPISHNTDGSTMNLDKGDDSMFIFKLVPPRAGLSRAVNFTKPTVHYFAVPNLKQGRLWMAAMMKATIDRDDDQPITTTYQQKTISLAKAKQMRHRPPALMNLDETTEEEPTVNEEKKDAGGLGMVGEADSGVSGMDKLAGHKIDSPQLNIDFDKDSGIPPQSA